MSIQQTLEHKIAAGIDALHLEVINESHRHNVAPGSETHFKVVVVSEDFHGRRPVQRHRMVYELVREEMSAGVHALALHTYSGQDWRSRPEATPGSPLCVGGKAGASG